MLSTLTKTSDFGCTLFQQCLLRARGGMSTGQAWMGHHSRCILASGVGALMGKGTPASHYSLRSKQSKPFLERVEWVRGPTPNDNVSLQGIPSADA